MFSCFVITTHDFFHFNTYVHELLFTPVCAQGVSLDSTLNIYFPVRIFDTKFPPYQYTPETIIFPFRENGHMTSIRKTTFPKGFFNDISLTVGEHEYIYITEIRFKITSVSKWPPKQFCHISEICLFMRLPENGTGDFIFFF